jgi:hypothetical protein
MALVKGLGVCLIPKEDGTTCGQQLAEGEPIGTVIHGAPMVGHRKCADAFHARKAAAEREKREAMVKRVDQTGPGGAVDWSTQRDAIQGSIPLEKSPGKPLESQGDLRAAANVLGVKPLSDLPMEESPWGAPTDPTPVGGDSSPIVSGIHTLTVDLSQVPPTAEILQISLDLRKLRGPRER